MNAMSKPRKTKPSAKRGQDITLTRAQAEGLLVAAEQIWELDLVMLFGIGKDETRAFYGYFSGTKKLRRALARRPKEVVPRPRRVQPPDSNV